MLKLRSALAGCLLLSGLVSLGCDSQGGSSGAVASGVKPGPHGGVAVPLVDGKVYSEVKVEQVGASKAKPQTRMVVYFLNNDLKGLDSAAPSSVTLKVVPPVGEPSTVTLTPEPVASDPLAKNRFVSAPGKYDFDELTGEVTASVDGATHTKPFAFR